MTDSYVTWFLTAESNVTPEPDTFSLGPVFYGRLRLTDWALTGPTAFLVDKVEHEFKSLMADMRSADAADSRIVVDWSTLKAADPIIELRWPEFGLQRRARRRVPAVTAALRQHLIPAEREKS